MHPQLPSCHHPVIPVPLIFPNYFLPFPPNLRSAQLIIVVQSLSCVRLCDPMNCSTEMATHFSVLAWRIPGIGEPGGLPSMGSHRVGHDWSELAVAAAAAAAAGFSVLNYLPEFVQTHVHRVMPSNHVILCHPLLFLPSIFPSIRVFSNKSALHIRSPKYWSFSISPSNEYSGLISFSINWFDLLAVQGTQESSPASTAIRKHQFFNTQLSLWSNSHICTWLLEKPNIALSIWIFVGKVVSLLFNALSSFVIAFPPRSKRLLISWLQSPSVVILEPKKRKSVTVSTLCMC